MEAKATDLITDDDYEAFKRIFDECFPVEDDGKRLMQGYLILRVLSARLERDMGIPFVQVDLGLEDE